MYCMNNSYSASFSFAIEAIALQQMKSAIEAIALCYSTIETEVTVTGQYVQITYTARSDKIICVSTRDPGHFRASLSV